jgi:hypothetical protein
MVSDIYYGLSERAVRKFSFEYAITLNIKILEGWRDTKMAGTEWFAKFLKEHESHSLRKHEATSISRASSLTRLMLMLFFYKSETSVWSSAACFGRHMEHGRNGYRNGADI